MGGLAMALAAVRDIVGNQGTMTLMTVQAGHLGLMGLAAGGNLTRFPIMALCAIRDRQGRLHRNRGQEQKHKHRQQGYFVQGKNKFHNSAIPIISLKISRGRLADFCR